MYLGSDVADIVKVEPLETGYTHPLNSSARMPIWTPFHDPESVINSMRFKEREAEILLQRNFKKCVELSRLDDDAWGDRGIGFSCVGLTKPEQYTIEACLRGSVGINRRVNSVFEETSVVLKFTYGHHNQVEVVKRFINENLQTHVFAVYSPSACHFTLDSVKK
jgi:hypothetical protein